MEVTYATQRFEINKQVSVHEINKRWPFLCEKWFLLKHFNNLMGVNLQDTFDSEIEKKVDLWID